VLEIAGIVLDVSVTFTVTEIEPSNTNERAIDLNDLCHPPRPNFELPPREDRIAKL
jgi:hypothetical protein